MNCVDCVSYVACVLRALRWMETPLDTTIEASILRRCSNALTNSERNQQETSRFIAVRRNGPGCASCTIFMQHEAKKSPMRRDVAVGINV